MKKIKITRDTNSIVQELVNKFYDLEMKKGTNWWLNVYKNSQIIWLENNVTSLPHVSDFQEGRLIVQQPLENFTVKFAMFEDQSLLVLDVSYE